MVNEWKENYVELLFPWAHQKWSINVEPVQCETHNKKNETHRSMWNEEHFDQISIQHVQKIYNTRGLKIENQTGCAFHSIAATHTTWNRSHVCVCNRTFNSHHHFHKKIVFSFFYSVLNLSYCKFPSKFHSTITKFECVFANQMNSKIIKWKTFEKFLTKN